MPALAIASALREARPDLEPVLVGATRGVESHLLPARPYRYHLLAAEPIYRRQWWKNIRWPFIAARLMGQMRTLLHQEQPMLVVGTGGYASGPLVWLAHRRGIPTAIQEQNAFPGLATRWLARRVDHVYLGLPEARHYLEPGPRTTVFDTGNPIVPPAAGRREAARARLGIPQGLPVVLVTGGSQGALAINRAIAAWLDGGGGRDTALLWATGRGTYDQFRGYARPPLVQVFDFLDPMSDAMAAGDLAVARGGAITIAEMCAHGLPGILIPLPTSAADHQSSNARALAEAGAAIHLPQSELTEGSLGEAIEGLLADPVRRRAMSVAASTRGRPLAAAEIVAHLLALLAGSSGPNGGR